MARAGLFDHRKFKRLVHMLQEPVPHCVGYLECLWSVGYQQRHSFLGDEIDVCLAAQYPGDAKKIVAALLQDGVGFIERTSDGKYQIHDLYDHAPYYVQKHMERHCPTLSDIVRHCPTKLDNDQQDKEKDKEKRKNKDNTSSSSTTSDGKPESTSKARRQPDPLWDAVVEVTGASSKAKGSHIGRIVKALRAEDPPYTPGEVRRLRQVLLETQEWFRQKPQQLLTLGTVQEWYYLVRAPRPGADSDAKVRAAQRAAENDALYGDAS